MSKAQIFGGHGAVEHYQESLQRAVATPPPLPPAPVAPKAKAPPKRRGKVPAAPPSQGFVMPPRDGPGDPPEQMLPVPDEPWPQGRHRRGQDDGDQPDIRGNPRFIKGRLRPAPLAVPPPPPRAQWVSNTAVGGDGDATGAEAPSAMAGPSGGDPIKDARELLAAFRSVVEKLAQAAEKLAEAGDHRAAQRLDVA